ncbi:MAG TPA: intradiol ring-cleavage dioxygenase, partial [Edaphobacter sp.]
ASQQTCESASQRFFVAISLCVNPTTGTSSVPIGHQITKDTRLPIKPSFSRRRFLTRSLATATALHLAPEVFALPPACTLAPEQEVGPFYVANELIRSNIAEDRPGVPLHLRLTILDVHTCAPIPNAAIDLWHCDALGLYSGYTKANLGPPPGGPDSPQGGPGGPPPGFDPNRQGPPGPPRDGGPGGFGPPPAMKPTDKLTFLRGIQLTGNDGSVAFQTIFPGFYQGRVNHIHYKVRVGGHADGKTYATGHTSHVGQLFFPEDLTAKLMATKPYVSHPIHRTTQSEDGIFIEQHGNLFIATVTPLRQSDLASGLRAELTVAVDPTATPAPVQPGGPPPHHFD